MRVAEWLGVGLQNRNDVGSTPTAHSMIGKVTQVGRAALPVAAHAAARLGFPDLHGEYVLPNLDIDMSNDVIVLWVVGTSNHKIHPTFGMLARLQWPDATIHVVDYMASWQFSKSKPNGDENFRATLDYIRKRLRKGQKVYVAGESQGAWIISDVMAEKKYADLITKAVLFGHPGPADTHFPPGGKVMEINHPADITSYPIDVDKHEMVKNVEGITHGDLTTIPYWLGIGFKHPDAVVRFAVQMIGKLPVLKDILTDPHDYRKDMYLAVLWLAHE